MIRTEKSHLKSVAGSHPGMTGKNNEDRYGVSAFLLDDETSTPSLFAIMADGIGGHRAGEVAAEMVVDLVSQRVAESDASKPQATLQEAIQFASNEVYRLAQADGGRKGMGATVVCAWVIGKQLYTAYVGDSRIYLIRNGQIFRLTRDHSWIQEALDNGILTPEQAVGHPNAHVIRRYIGSPEPADVDFRLRLHPDESDGQSLENQGFTLMNGDQILLCSDGLTDLVDDLEILAYVTDNLPEEAVQKLTDLANQRGGHDNITIILIKVPEGVFVEKNAQTRPSRLPMRTIGLGCLAIVLLLGLAAAGFFGWRWLQENRGKDTPTPALTAPQQETLAATREESKPTSSAKDATAQPGLTAESSPMMAPVNSGASEEGNIAPPPDATSMTAVPTNTIPATSTPTPTATATATITITPTTSSTP